MDVRVAEEAEVDREEDGKVPPCGDGSGGEAAREVRRAWAWRSSPEGSGGGEDSTGRGGKMAPEALGGVSGREPRKGVGDRVSRTVRWLDLVPEMETRRIRGARAGESRD
jgi:hypothetical protein